MWLSNFPLTTTSGLPGRHSEKLSFPGRGSIVFELRPPSHIWVTLNCPDSQPYDAYHSNIDIKCSWMELLENFTYDESWCLQNAWKLSQDTVQFTVSDSAFQTGSAVAFRRPDLILQGDHRLSRKTTSNPPSNKDLQRHTFQPQSRCLLVASFNYKRLAGGSLLISLMHHFERTRLSHKVV